MTNRLKYETSAGNLSEAITYQQLLEYLRLAEEDSRTLSDLRKSQSDDGNSKRWRVIAENLSRTQDIITVLATGKGRTSVGYDGHG